MPDTERQSVPTIRVANGDRILNVHADLPDLRDRMYEPSLIKLKQRLDPLAETPAILDQGTEGACTGFALAAVVNLLNASRNMNGDADLPVQVSPRMLYEMARLHDEWPGEDYDGSSIRGVVKGFFHNGVCSLEMAPYDPGEENWTLTVEQAKDARKVGLGAYYRLRPEMIDYHAALNEVGAIIVSANVHRGWMNPPRGRIRKSSIHEGGHAFAIVGYDRNGFLVQNSWGTDWGGFSGWPGIAHWSYEDWAENVIDAWVLRLSVPTPDAFRLTHMPRAVEAAEMAQAPLRPLPRRHEIIGHFIHLDDGKLVDKGRYGTDLATIGKTADFLRRRANEGENGYRHLLLYAHGGLNSASSSARRIAAMRDVFKRNGIYPIHLMWETGFTEELADVLKEVFMRSKARVGFGRDALDWAIEKFAGGIGRKVWSQMKLDARRAFAADGDGTLAIRTLLAANAEANTPLTVNLVGHSAGSILIAWLLEALSDMDVPEAAKVVASCSLMAPACTVDLYERVYRPVLEAGNRVSELVQYNLIDSRELDDTVGPYGKSLLYFVSRAFEDRKGMPLLGMEKYSAELELANNHEILYAGHRRAPTDSKTHGGFDNDRLTMNHILETILGQSPSRTKAFQESELIGY